MEFGVFTYSLNLTYDEAHFCNALELEHDRPSIIIRLCFHLLQHLQPQLIQAKPG